MSKRNSEGVVGRILLWFVAAFVIVGTVAGVKYAMDKDFGLNSSSDDFPPITSQEPPTSTEPATSEEPVTSEIPPVTSEDPEPAEQMPAPLHDADDYGDLIEYQGQNLRIADIQKPSNLTNTYSMPWEGIAKATTNNGTEIDLKLKSNSIRWDNASQSFVLGFGSAYSTETNATESEFYFDNDGTKYNYAAALIFDFTITTFPNEGLFSLEIGGHVERMTVFYRTSVEDGWFSYSTLGNGEANFVIDQYDFDNTQVQFALVMQTNNKSKNEKLPGNGYEFALNVPSGTVAQPLNPQPEGLIRIVSSSDKFSFKKDTLGNDFLVSIGLEVSSTVGSKVIDGNNIVEFTTTLETPLILTIKLVPGGEYVEIDYLQFGINYIKWETDTFILTDFRPFYASDFD